MAFSFKYVEFGGTDEYVTSGNVLDFTQNHSLSVSFWAKVPSLGGPFPIVSKTGGPSPQGWSVFVDSTRHLSFRLVYSYAPDDWYGVDVSEAGFSADAWHHCVVTYDGLGATAMYVDGAVKTTSVVNNTLLTSITNAYDLTLGRMVNDGVASFLVGDLDEVGIYDQVLSPTEVTWIYNGGEARDLLDGGAPPNLAAWWRMGEGDTFPTLLDSTLNAFNGTMTNMEAGDIKDLITVIDAEANLSGGSFSRSVGLVRKPYVPIVRVPLSQVGPLRLLGSQPGREVVTKEPSYVVSPDILRRR